MTEEVGKPVDAIALKIQGERGMTEEIQRRLLTHKSLHGLSVGDLVALSKDLAESALSYAADYTFNHRVINGYPVRVKERS